MNQLLDRVANDSVRITIRLERDFRLEAQMRLLGEIEEAPNRDGLVAIIVSVVLYAVTL